VNANSKKPSLSILIGGKPHDEPDADDAGSSDLEEKAASFAADGDGAGLIKLMRAICQQEFNKDYDKDNEG